MNEANLGVQSGNSSYSGDQAATSNVNSSDNSVKSPRKSWNIGKENMDTLKRSANKYSVLETLEENSNTEGLTTEGKIIVDKYVDYQRKPSQMNSGNGTRKCKNTIRLNGRLNGMVRIKKW